MNNINTETEWVVDWVRYTRVGKEWREVMCSQTFETGSAATKFAKALPKDRNAVQGIHQIAKGA
jgi:hypothetical protein